MLTKSVVEHATTYAIVHGKTFLIEVIKEYTCTVSVLISSGNLLNENQMTDSLIIFIYAINHNYGQFGKKFL